MYYGRDGKEIDCDTWTRRFEDRSYQKLADDHVNGWWISTIWLGLDHSFGGSLPQIFETMVFRGSGNDLMDALDELVTGESRWHEHDSARYATEEEAIEGHRRMVEKWAAVDKQADSGV